MSSHLAITMLLQDFMPPHLQLQLWSTLPCLPEQLFPESCHTALWGLTCIAGILMISNLALTRGSKSMCSCPSCSLTEGSRLFPHFQGTKPFFLALLEGEPYLREADGQHFTMKLNLSLQKKLIHKQKHSIHFHDLDCTEGPPERVSRLLTLSLIQDLVKTHMFCLAWGWGMKVINAPLLKWACLQVCGLCNDNTVGWQRSHTAADDWLRHGRHIHWCLQICWQIWACLWQHHCRWKPTSSLSDSCQEVLPHNLKKMQNNFRCKSVNCMLVICIFKIPLRRQERSGLQVWQSRHLN